MADPYDKSRPDTHEFALPGSTYDRNADDEFAPGHDSATRLKEAETGGQGLYNPQGDQGMRDADGNDPKGGDSAGRLRKSENDSGKGGGSLYNEDGDKPTGRFAAARHKVDKAKTKFNNVTNNKFFLGVGVLGSSGFILMILLIIIGSSLKIPHLVENSAAYQFARVTRQSYLNSRNIMGEKIAIDAADNQNWGKIRQKYAATTGKAKDVHEKLTNKFSPNKIAYNYGEANHFKLEYGATSTFRGARLTGVTLDNQTYRIQSPGTFKQFIPGVQTVYNVRNAQQLAPYLNESLKIDGYGPIMRSRIIAQMRRELGISLVAWKTGEYSGKNREQARIQQARDLYKAVAKDDTTKVRTGALQEATDEAKQKLDEEVKDDAKLKKILDRGGVSETVSNLVDKAVSGTGGLLRGFTAAISPTYSVGLPVCLIYDGSLQSSKDTMDNQQAQLRRTAAYASTAAGQQKDGYNAVPEGVGALNEQYGDISNSNIEIRARGGQVNTAAYLSAQAAPTGDYTIFDATAIASVPGAATTFNFIADKACPALTNVYVGLGIGGLNIAACFLTGGLECVGVKTVQEGSEKFLGRVAAKFTERFVTKSTSRIEKNSAIAATIQGSAASAGGFAKKTGVNVAAITAGTLIAKSIVYSHSNQLHNGLQQGTDLADDTDNGFNLEAQANMSRMYGGRPLTDEENASVMQDDKATVAANLKSKSAFERYASINNPSSLISHMAVMSSSISSQSAPNSLFKLASSIFLPFKSLPGLASSIVSPFVSASTTPHVSAQLNYGNVGTGFSPEESALIRSSPSYSSMLANQKILDESGVEDQINEKYLPCLTKQMTELIADSLVARNEDGNVIRDKGLCSPDNLSFNSPDSLAVDTSGDSPKNRDMIFRWRVAYGYNNTLDDMIDKQEVTANDAVAADSPSSDSDSAEISGDVQELAKEILSNSNITLISPNPNSSDSVKNDVKLASEGKPGTAGKPIDIRAFQIVLALAKKHKVVVTAYESNGSGHSKTSDHYTGHAVDIDTIDGKEAFQTITDYWPEIKDYSKGAVFLQGDCPGAKAAPSGMNRLPGDACNHQHISLK